MIEKNGDSEKQYVRKNNASVAQYIRGSAAALHQDTFSSPDNY